MLIEILKKIPDPRDPQGREYYLHDVLYISALAILANAKGYLDIHRFMTVHFESLKSALSLKWRQVPNPSAIRKIIVRVPLEDIEKAFREHAQELLNSQAPTSTSTCHLCVDGKALRGSFSHTIDRRAQQVFKCFRRWLTPCLGSCRNGEQRKRNTNIAEPFAYSKFKGNFCNCRCHSLPKKTFECAETAGANLIVQVKKNQKSLLKQITHGSKVGNSLAKKIDDPQKHHGRLEERSYEISSATEVLKHWPEWEHVQEIIVVSRKRTILSRVSPPKIETEVSYYVSNTKAKASCYPKYIREHWFAENKLHNVKDVAFQEDRLPKRICALNYSCLVDFALNVLRASGSDNIRGTLYTASLNFFGFLKNGGVNL